MDGSKSHEVANVAASAGEKRKRESESKVSTSVRKGKVFIGENDRAEGKATLGEPNSKPKPKPNSKPKPKPNSKPVRDGAKVEPKPNPEKPAVFAPAAAAAKQAAAKCTAEPDIDAELPIRKSSAQLTGAIKLVIVSAQ
jgi:hypothetical protein